jgi:DNA-binding transcriptional ArsR family regulator
MVHPPGQQSETGALRWRVPSGDVGAVLIVPQIEIPGMVRDPFAEDDTPELQDILDALDDPDCRSIVRILDEPMTADEIAEAADVPLSTTYRKLDLLTEASLLEEGTEIRPDGQHASRYSVAFEEVIIGIADTREFEVDISRRPRTADERLANLWSEVQKET